MEKANKKQEEEKAIKNPAPKTGNDLKTDFPLSEKDEVKQAEEKTQSHSKNAGSNS